MGLSVTLLVTGVNHITRHAPGSLLSGGPVSHPPQSATENGKTQPEVDAIADQQQPALYAAQTAPGEEEQQQQ